MKRRAAVVMVVVMVLVGTPSASAAPYISCPGGYIADSGDKCPPFRTPISVHPGRVGGGGGGAGGGGLIGTIGRIVHGLTGGLL